MRGDCPDFCGRTPQKWDCPLPFPPQEDSPIFANTKIGTVPVLAGGRWPDAEATGPRGGIAPPLSHLRCSCSIGAITVHCFESVTRLLQAGEMRGLPHPGKESATCRPLLPSFAALVGGQIVGDGQVGHPRRGHVARCRARADHAGRPGRKEPSAGATAARPRWWRRGASRPRTCRPSRSTTCIRRFAAIVRHFCPPRPKRPASASARWRSSARPPRSARTSISIPLPPSATA